MSIDLPHDFEAYTRELFGALYEPFCRALGDAAPVSLRLNPLKPGKSVVGDAIPWCAGGYWLPAREAFTLDPLFHCGCYYVQEAASMFLDTVLRQYVSRPVTMLDLCAAPGGKATLARGVLPEGSVLYCNEVDRRRVNILVETMQKQGHSDVVVTNNTAADYQRSGMLFNIILADVPCSGEGMFRKDPAAISCWSIKNVVSCAAQQRSIVEDIWRCLKVGGIMIYSTCTFNTRENEENVAWIAATLGAELLAVAVDARWGITSSLLPSFTAPVYRFIPGITRSEGLFVAVLQKTRGATGTPAVRHRQRLRVVYDGRDMCAYRAHEGVPSAAEALYYALPAERFPRVALTRDDALRYLRRAPLLLDAAVPRGFVVVCYDGHPLGFVKNLGTRANNLYPAEWRIRNK